MRYEIILSHDDKHWRFDPSEVACGIVVELQNAVQPE